MSRESQIQELRDTSPKLVIVGQQPNANDPEDPLSPDNPMWAGYRLMQMAEMDADTYRACFHRVNINYVNEGSFKVSTPQRTRAAEIWATGRRGDTFIILGTAVLKAFKGILPPTLAPLEPHFNQYPGNDGLMHEGPSFVLMPHPSGLNRWYNDPTNFHRAAEFMKHAIMMLGPPKGLF